eukprot:1139140-Pelagomonas_calceolata.AAC.2
MGAARSRAHTHTHTHTPACRKTARPCTWRPAPAWVPQSGQGRAAQLPTSFQPSSSCGSRAHTQRSPQKAPLAGDACGSRMRVILMQAGYVVYMRVMQAICRSYTAASTTDGTWHQMQDEELSAVQMGCPD